jgi:hypothetical protein
MWDFGWQAWRANTARAALSASAGAADGTRFLPVIHSAEICR